MSSDTVWNAYLSNEATSPWDVMAPIASGSGLHQSTQHDGMTTLPSRRCSPGISQDHTPTLTVPYEAPYIDYWDFSGYLGHVPPHPQHMHQDPLQATIGSL